MTTRRKIAALVAATCLLGCEAPPVDGGPDEAEEVVWGNCTLTGIAPLVEGAMVAGQVGWECEAGSHLTQMWEIGLDEAPPDSEAWDFIGESFQTHALGQGRADTSDGWLIFGEPGTCYRTQATDTPEHWFHVVSADVACF